VSTNGPVQRPIRSRLISRRAQRPSFSCFNMAVQVMSTYWIRNPN
jgi:hypothetical protein